MRKVSDLRADADFCCTTFTIADIWQVLLVPRMDGTSAVELCVLSGRRRHSLFCLRFTLPFVFAFVPTSHGVAKNKNQHLLV